MVDVEVTIGCVEAVGAGSQTKRKDSKMRTKRKILVLDSSIGKRFLALTADGKFTSREVAEKLLVCHATVYNWKSIAVRAGFKSSQIKFLPIQKRRGIFSGILKEMQRHDVSGGGSQTAGQGG